MSGMSTEKALDFKGSSRRLGCCSHADPYRLLLILASFAVSAVTLQVLGPACSARPSM